MAAIPLSGLETRPVSFFAPRAGCQSGRASDATKNQTLDGLLPLGCRPLRQIRNPPLQANRDLGLAARRPGPLHARASSALLPTHSRRRAIKLQPNALQRRSTISSGARRASTIPNDPEPSPTPLHSRARRFKNLLHQAVVLHGHSALLVTAAQPLLELGAQDSSRLLKRLLRLRPTVPSMHRRTDDRRPRSGLIPAAVPEPVVCAVISRRGSGCGASSGAMLRSAVVFLIPSIEQMLHLRWPPVLISSRRRVPRLGQEFCQP